MFYRPEGGHGLPHAPWNAIIAPRPIGWISTRGRDGADNLAPYSFFNAVAYTPPQVMFASTSAKPDRPGTKDSVAQITETGVFCVNIAGAGHAEAMNATSAALPAGVSEFEACGIAGLPCEAIDCLRVADAVAAIECRVSQIIPLAGSNNWLVLGVAVGVHLRDDCILDGRFDPRPAGGWLGRMGYKDYCKINDLFEMERP